MIIKKKILYIINFWGGGGVEKFLIDLIKRINKDKYEIELLILVDYKKTYLLNEIEGVKITRLSAKKLYSLDIIYKLIKYLKNTNYDLIHTNLFPTQFYIPIIKKILGQKYKLITTEHGISERRKKYKLFYYLEKWSYKQYDKIVGVSSIVSEKLLEEYPELELKMLVIENGIDIDKFAFAKKCPREKFNLLETDVVLTMVGRLDVGKDQLTIIKALKYLPNNYKLLIVGIGNLKDYLELEVKRMELENRVIFVGFTNQIEKIYKISDINILSTYSEGLSLVTLEAMASKRPFIGSDVDGVKQIVKNAGILFKYKDVQELVSKIKSLENKEYYREIAEKCYSKAKLFSIEIMKTKYENLYKRLLNEIKN